MHPFDRFMREFPGGTLADALAWLEQHMSSASREDQASWSTWYRADTRICIAHRYLAAWNYFSSRAGRRSCSTAELSIREAMTLVLPTEPRYVITGRSLMPEQAKEVILATDKLFIHFLDPGVSDDEEWNTWAIRQLGYDFLYERMKVDGSIYGWRDLGHVLLCLDRVSRELDHLKLKQLTNSWAAGRGWCHPSGQIQGSGTWEEPFRLRDLINELNSLANRFGYLDFWLTLLDGNTPLVTLHADGGMYGPEECYRGGRGTVRFFAGSLEPHGATEFVDTGPRKRLMPDEWVIECGRLLAPTIWRIVPPRRY